MRAAESIGRKRDGERLSDDEIRRLIAAYAKGELPDYQMSALAMAIFFQGLDARELATWTDAMLRSGEVLDLGHIPGAKVDKHSTGGVGDKISLPLAPLAAACGLRVPMISGRGLGHTGGTLDKLESIPGFRTDLPVSRFIECVADDALGFGLIGQTDEICPADKRLYGLRDVTATVESIPLIASSIMSKKLAEGIDGLVLDVKVGSGAFMKTEARARALAETMVGIGERTGCRTVALLTDMSAPLGRMVGNALEVRESLDVLRGGGPDDVRALTIRLAVEMLVLGGRDRDDAERDATAALDDGRALDRFRAIVEVQGGDPRVIDDPDRLPTAPKHREHRASTSGYLTAIDTTRIGLAAMTLGAGRAQTDDRVDPRVGLEICARPGDRIEAGQPLCIIHHADTGLDGCIAHLDAAWTLGDAAPEPRPLIIDRIAAKG